MQVTSPSQRQPRLLFAVLAVAVLAVVGGLVGRELYRVPDQEPPIVRSSATPLPRAEQPGPPAVAATTDAAQHPQYETIRQLMQTHFDAINGRRYDRWKTTVTKAKMNEMLEPHWQRAYRSTRDGSIVVHRLEAAPESQLRVLVSFTSTQDLADAPDDMRTTCIRWRVVLALSKREENRWKIDVGPAGLSPQREECPAA